MSNQNNRFLDMVHRVSYLLFIILACEVAVGSSGRWLEIGPLSIRMVLFAALFVVSLPLIFHRLKEVLTNRLVLINLVFGVYLVFGAVMGFMAGNARSFLVADITSFLFLALLPTSLVVIDTKERLKKLLFCLLITITLFALATIIIHYLLIYLSEQAVIDFNKIINDIHLGGFFKFEEQSYRIYFKSAIFHIFGFAYSFFILMKSENASFKKQYLHYISIILNTIAIVLTYTRSIWIGYVIAFIIVCIPFFKVKERSIRILKLFSVVLCGFAVFICSSFALIGKEVVVSNAVKRVVLGIAVSNQLQTNKGNDDPSDITMIDSENIRIRTKEEVYKEIGKNPILGSGLGANLDSIRTDGKIEYMYLDVMYKLGGIGLLLYLLTLAAPFIMYIRWYLKRKDKGVPTDLCLPVMAALLGFYVSSAYNPFMLSPLGMSLYCIACAALYIYKKDERKG